MALHVVDIVKKSSGSNISFPEVLQLETGIYYSPMIISFTMHMVGPVKNAVLTTLISSDVGGTMLKTCG